MIQNQFGNAIRKIRQRQCISQEKFSLKIEMDRTYYASVELGRRNISIKNIQKIAEGFGLTISDLFLMIEREQNND